MSQDRNFDDLTHRFHKNIYATPKGQLRVAILKEDLRSLLTPPNGSASLRILDAGCGHGQLSLWLAEQGHEMVLCDHSAEMLSEAKARFQETVPNAKVNFIHSSVQEMGQHIEGSFDLILFHAVLEWLHEPAQTLKELSRFMHADCVLSLMYYNRNSLIFRNLIRGNFRKVASGEYQGDPGSLTPSNPLDPEEVECWLKQMGLTIQLTSGVRVVYDYLSRDLRESRSYQDILEMERLVCRREAFKFLGRYVHVLAKK